jgi:hypothetical protein
MIVELHDFIDPTISATLRARFESTHELQIAGTASRDQDAYPDLAPFPAGNRRRAVDEGRPESMEWGWFLARERAPSRPSPIR